MCVKRARVTRQHASLGSDLDAWAEGKIGAVEEEEDGD